ncbi:MAG TPA: hypothetical protein VF691_10805, partial [Cytophagaceae bacterium]
MKKRSIIFIVAMALVILAQVNSLAQAGQNDPTFNPSDVGFSYGDGPDADPWVAMTQNDGKILVGGFFRVYDGIARMGIARLNNDGSLDNSFDPGSGIDEWRNITSIAVQSDGKVIIAGSFYMFNGLARNQIARLNSDGSIDTSFDAGDAPYLQHILGIQSVAIQEDGKILIVESSRVTRLNQDGSLDKSFDTGKGTDLGSTKVVVQPDGKILLAGYFTSFNGTAVNNILRLNEDGSLDQTFNTPLRRNDFNRATNITLQTDGKMLIMGMFRTDDNPPKEQIVRLNVDGTLDSSFAVDSVSRPTHIAVQGDGKIVIVSAVVGRDPLTNKDTGP